MIKNAWTGTHADSAVRRGRAGAAVVGATTAVSLIAVTAAASTAPAPLAHRPAFGVAPTPVAPAPAPVPPPGASTPAAPPAPNVTPAPTATPVPESRSTPEIHPQAVTKSLTVDYQAQETGSWCAPAAARIALSSKVKKLPDQETLASELGTTENGTNSILQVVDGLNRRLAGTGTEYVTRDWGSRPMTPAMTQQLWSDTVRDIDDGKAMVANIVATPDNQPPGYPSGQTFYHYVTIIGYNAAKKTLHISDPARFNGNEDYWLSLEQVASLIRPRGYAT
jgi:hypothetical protein